MRNGYLSAIDGFLFGFSLVRLIGRLWCDGRGIDVEVGQGIGCSSGCGCCCGGWLPFAWCAVCWMRCNCSNCCLSSGFWGFENAFLLIANRASETSMPVRGSDSRVIPICISFFQDTPSALIPINRVIGSHQLSSTQQQFE